MYKYMPFYEIFSHGKQKKDIDEKHALQYWTILDISGVPSSISWSWSNETIWQIAKAISFRKAPPIPAQALALAGGWRGGWSLSTSHLWSRPPHCHPAIYSHQYVVLPIHVITHMARWSSRGDHMGGDHHQQPLPPNDGSSWARGEMQFP